MAVRALLGALAAARRGRHLWRDASAVRERTSELGIRMALGARRRAVLALMLRHCLRLALIGAALGLALVRGGA
jgi:predicted lysophospholipase L1 biosynthesis ABC-type transport system permease subunit